MVAAEGTVAELHQRAIEPVRQITVCRPTDRALVLGAGQSESVLNHAALQTRGATWCRRGSGGGAVWVTPTNQLWLNVTIARDDPHWSPDVTFAAVWLGERLAAVVEPMIDGAVSVHRGPLGADPLGAVVCLASRGPGEVFVGAKKLVAISVKRALRAAVFQVSLVQEPDIEAYVDLLQLTKRDETVLVDRIGCFPTASATMNMNLSFSTLLEEVVRAITRE